jgi:hypothetical protein
MAVSASLTSPASVSSVEETPEWQLASARTAGQGGFAVSLALVFLFLYYVRPQDWVPGMAGVNVIRPLMVVWIGYLISTGLRSPLAGLMRTPQDWAVVIYGGYVVWNAPAGMGVGSEVFNLLVFYFLTAQSLTSWSGVFRYLKAWNLFLLIIAGFGVLQVMGVDITGGGEKTAFFLNRLSLGTWLTNNPNALGHTIVPAIPLSYLLFFWRGSVIGRFFVFPACFALVAFCAWQTESKGSFLVGAGLTVLLFVVGRPKWIQILVVALSLTVGVGALQFMPRMQQMGNLRADDGVLGRLMAWEMAKTAMDTNPTGVGWKQFVALIDWKEGNKIYRDIPKATHSSYVQVGADLGKYGLALWLLGLWTVIRITISFKAQTDEEERCRRAALLLVVAYLASGWMINRQYHTEYFLIIGVAAAIQRLVVARSLALPETGKAASEDEKEEEVVEPVDAWLAKPLTAEGELPVAPPKKKMWNRLTWFDLAMGAALAWLAIEIWQYILKNL